MYITLFASIILILNKNTCGTIVSLETNGTEILGKKLFTIFNNKPFISFYRIPYAEPPVGALRFKPPKQVHRLTKQFYNYSKPYEETCTLMTNEDCLYLNIYTPYNNNKKTNVAVVVWLHEMANLNLPDFLIDEDIIVITVSFRTSILGFLNTEDEFSKGNMGAKDILLSLKWVRDNIIYFNGDPNRVTVIGSGASANIVASFLLSHLAEDLFSRVVIQSGSALAPADYNSYNFAILNKLFWMFFGPNTKLDRVKLYKRLLSASLEELAFASEGLIDSTEVRDNQRLINVFGPTLETLRKGAFMYELPIEMYKKGINTNVDVMMGFASLESMYKLEGLLNNRKLLTYLNYNFQYLLPFEGRRDEYGSRRYKEIRRKIMDFYFVNGTIRERSLRRYAKYLSDQVIYPMLRQARLHTQMSRNHVYLYRFSFKGSLNVVWDATLSYLNLTGATNGDEICYQFRCKYLSELYDTIEENGRRFIKKMSRLLANFAKYGQPTLRDNDEILGKLNWENLQPKSKIKVMNLGKKMKLIELPERKRIEFWDQMQEKYFSVKKIKDEL